MIDLYTWSTPNGRKVSIALEEFGLDYETHPVNIGADEQFHPDYLKISPNNKIPAIVDRDTGLSLMESGAILVYLAEKTGKFMPRSGEGRWRVVEWLMWQMGGVGPMLGQVHHFVKFNPGSSEYAERRFRTEADRLYGVMNDRLADRPYLAGGRVHHRGHGGLAVDLALRVAGDRLRGLPEREALVRRDRATSRGAAGVPRAEEGESDPDPRVSRASEPAATCGHRS